jgi:hypothetical protein
VPIFADKGLRINLKKYGKTTTAENAPHIPSGVQQ